MAVIFLDTSAVVKRYAAEPGSQRVRDLTAGADSHISHVTVVEYVAAVCRQGRSGRLTDDEVSAAIRVFRADAEAGYDLLGVTTGVISIAAVPAERHAVPGYDAVRIASALSVQEVLASEPVKLVTADRQMCDVALAEGMSVIDPTDAAA
ncbi:type II toxin-antitoxin system VapC family toxin [Candidatus Poribacteria bacterium]|jgi:uncharacterized protein|nr:type II toxin-antitoxin system VapC family toxin [Candidatus Poribacteria bacterium]MBT5534417.1 type II toxin-antitoxin system VapC family toxin [Candidatus Poribacteria bacterium]MBT5709583.1 type II toxin-antitoxin system VapC family toxin [Candidatus Poribacteria bacterium]MBT7101097.1 type II toxin-antitoxin system VapC family toxin [Candidatus Poribacteria bacterium]MBT7807546.1 type II toxin-antitoxin system VapC family toxin [Candidatus Poribacteria bacterium]